MKKLASFTLGVCLCVVMAGVSFAQIGVNGGTEDFESVGSLTDGTQITEANISNISGWEYNKACAAPFFYYDDNDTIGFATDSGAGTKPVGSGCLLVSSTGATADQHRIGSTVMNLGRSVTFTAWFAVKAKPIDNNVRIGINFPTEADSNVHHRCAYLEVAHTYLTKDLSVAVRSEISTTGNDIILFVGASAADDTDYVLDTWNKLEINVTSSDSEEGQVDFTLNGKTIGQIALPVDAAGDLLDSKCFVLSWKTMSSGDVYVDDIHAESSGSSVSDWRMF